MSLLEIRNIDFFYEGGKSPGREKAIRNVSADIDEGDFISIIGKNGSGKSTLVKLIAGINAVCRGTILYNGTLVNSFSKKDFSKLVSYLPQSVELSENLKSGDFLLLGRYAYKKFSDFTFSNEDRDVTDAAIEAMGISKLKNRNITKLSGGEKQKVLITLSLVQLDITKSLKGKLLIIDEPLTHLDINHQLEIFNVVKKLNESGLTVLVVMHDLNLALTFSKKSMLMSGGELVKYSDTKSVITEEMLKEHFLIDSKILNFEKNYFISYLPY